MRRASLASALLVWFLAIPQVVALDATTAPDAQPGINRMAHLAALTHTDREKRSWKWLWLKPGKEVHYHYEWILEDGSSATQVLTQKLKHVPDRRPFDEAHPNLSHTMPVMGNLAGNILGSILGKHL